MNLYLIVTTKYLEPINNRGSRVKATLGSESITVHYQSSMDPSEMHMIAAERLLAEMEIKYKRLKGGEIDKGYAFLVE